MDNFLIVTGGTGGHILPAIEIALELAKNGKNVLLIMNESSWKKFAYFLQYIDTNKCTFIFTKDMNYNWKLPFIFIQNLFITFKSVYNSDYILSFSSLYTVPVLFLSIIMRKILFLQEMDAVLNTTNKIFARFSYKILTTFKDTENISNKNQIYQIGIPIKALPKVQEKKIIFIMGATNGWHLFDKEVSRILASITEIQYYLIYHNCRNENIKYLKDFYVSNLMDVYVSNYFPHYESILQESALIISRSGASSIAYIGYLNKNAIIIPWKDAAHNHQLLNSQKIASVNGAIVVEEKNINTHLKQKIEYILGNPNPHRGKNILEVLKVQNPSKYYEELNDLIKNIK